MAIIVFGLLFTENLWGEKKKVWMKLCVVSVSSLSDLVSFCFTWQSTEYVCVCPRGSPYTTEFLIISIQHIGYLRFEIGAVPMFFPADSVTLNTPHTTGKSDKIICRTIKIIGTLPRIIGRGELGPKSARLSCSVWVSSAKWERCQLEMFLLSLCLAITLVFKASLGLCLAEWR